MSLSISGKLLKPLFTATLLLAGAIATFAQTPYEVEIQTWRQQREAKLKAEDGWLTVAGLFWLKEGINTFGTDPTLDIVLPQNTAHGKVGSLELHQGVVTLRVEAGVTVQANDQPVKVLEVKSDVDEKPDSIGVGELKLSLIKRGERFGLRLRDKNSQARREFKGLSWFPVSEKYRVTATFVPFDQPKGITIINVVGDVLKMQSPGMLSFQLDGQQFHLQPVIEEDEHQLFIIFRDLTAGKSTYPAGRFLYADLPKDGKVVLDFNEATNPPCAFTAYATCPLPPKQNYLRVAVEAGELTYHLKNAEGSRVQPKRSARGDSLKKE